MKRTNLKKILFFLSFVCCVNAFALDSEYCYHWIDPSGTGAVADDSDQFYISWNTETNGDITIRLIDYPGNTKTIFRGNGMKIDGFAVNGEKDKLTHAINDEKTMVTLTPVDPLQEGDKITYEGNVEYRIGESTALNNLYPNLQFEFSYGATCTPIEAVPFATPVVTDINTERAISFTCDPEASKHTVYVYRENTELLVHQQEDIVSGDVIEWTTPGTYTVKVQSITDRLEYLNSDLSASFEWTIEGEREPWVEHPSEYCDYMMGSGDAVAFITWATDEHGKVIVTIAGVDDDTETAFRNNGLKSDGFSINGQAGTWFSSEINEAKTEITLTPLIALYPGDKINYNAIVEYKTAQNENLYPTLSFDYTYGSNCTSAPKVTVSESAIHFAPTDGRHLFYLTGENLTGELTLKAPKGISVSPESITPDENGSIAETAVQVIWEEGSSAGGKIVISGGGLTWDKEIALSSDGFSEYCNRVITQSNNGKDNPAYLLVELSEDSTEMSFIISAYEETQTVAWKNNSIPADKILINGVAPETEPSRTFTDNDLRITIGFKKALSAGDIVTFGASLVWSIKEEETVINNNCFIDPALTYTVGAGCELEETELAVTGVSEATEVSKSGAKVTVEVTAGEFPIAKIRFKEDNGKSEDIIVNRKSSNVYQLTGLEEATAYTFSVSAIDTEGNESAPHADKVTFETLKTVILSIKSVGEPFEQTANSVKVRVEINEGDYALAQIRFHEDDNKLSDLLLNAQEDGIYTLEGLEATENYSFSVSALDVEGNESAVFANHLIVNSLPSGWKLAETDDLLIYPVPAKDRLYIQGLEQAASIKLIDCQGRIVFETVSDYEINLPALNGGLYLIRINHPNGNTQVRKITIE